jgi:hypothetical protein
MWSPQGLAALAFFTQPEAKQGSRFCINCRMLSLPLHDPKTVDPYDRNLMYLVAIGWIYVVLMMAVAEALSSQGTLLGALITLLLYGVLPLIVLLYIMGTPLRRRRARREETGSAVEQHTGSHPTRDTVTTVGEKGG